MFSLICAWMNGWVNNRETGDLRRHHAYHEATVMGKCLSKWRYTDLRGPGAGNSTQYRSKHNIHHISFASTTMSSSIIIWKTGGRVNMKILKCRNSHHKHTAVFWSFYLYDRNSCTREDGFWYWNGLLYSFVYSSIYLASFGLSSSFRLHFFGCP